MGQSNGSLKVDTETATWPFWDPQTRESIGKKGSYSTHWGDWAWLQGESGLLLHHEVQEEYVWNARNSRESLNTPLTYD